MRLAIDIRSLMEGRHSGVEEYTVQIINAFMRVAPQHEYHLFYNAARAVSLPPLPAAAQFHRFRYPNKILNAAQWISGQPRWDRLVAADCFFMPSLRLIPLAADTPLVTTVHDLSFVRFPEFFSWRRRLWHRFMRPRHLMHASTRLIAVSHATARDLIDLYGISGDAISVIHSGVAEEQPPSSAAIAAVRQTYQLPARFILYFGTLEPRKNIPAIVEAFSAVAANLPHHLVLAGSRGWLTKALDDAIKQSPLRERIHLPGFIAQKDKAALYAAADVFVYPSFYEGFGFPPLESLVAGTPVITSSNSSLSEIVGDWASLVDPYDVGELALVLREHLHEPSRVPVAVRQAVQQRYRWDRAGQHTLQVLEKVAV